MVVTFLKIDFKLPTNTDNVNISMLAIDIIMLSHGQLPGITVYVC